MHSPDEMGRFFNEVRAGVEAGVRGAEARIYRFQNTKQPELRFQALLTADAQTGRFERVAVGST